MSSSAAPRKIRYAVVGLGHIAQTAVLPGFAHAPNSELAALVSGDAEKLARLGERHGVTALYSYDQYEDCLRDENIDAVYIALPNHLHLDFAVRAARAGKHILCEKPLALTVKECAAMIRAAEKRHVKLMTAYRLHFEPATLATMELIRSGRLGEGRLFTATFSYPMTDPDNIRTRPEAGGGALYDIGVYCINAARCFFRAEPEEIFAFSAHHDDPKFARVDDSTSAILRFPGRRFATFSVSFDATSTSRCEFVGTRGRVALDPAFEYSQGLNQHVVIDEQPETHTFPQTDQFGGEIEAFSQCLLDNKEPEPSGAEGLADLRVVEAVQRSARTGRPVKLKPLTKTARPTRAQKKQKPSTEEPDPINADAPFE